MGRLIAAAVVAVVAAGSAGAQEAVTFRAYAYKVGDRVRTTRGDEGKVVTTMTAGGGPEKTEERVSRTTVFVTEVLELGPDATKPTKLRRTYEKAVEAADGDEAPTPLHGKTVVIEKTAAGFAFAFADGTPLPAAALHDLETEFDGKAKFGDHPYPATPVKPGDTWDLTDRFLRSLADPASPFVVDQKEAAVRGRLVSVARRDGALVGETRLTADLPLTEFRAGGTIDLDRGSTWSVRLTAAHVLDGTRPDSRSDGTMHVEFQGTSAGTTLRMVTEMRLTGRTELLAPAAR